MFVQTGGITSTVVHYSTVVVWYNNYSLVEVVSASAKHLGL